MEEYQKNTVKNLEQEENEVKLITDLVITDRNIKKQKQFKSDSRFIGFKWRKNHNK